MGALDLRLSGLLDVLSNDSEDANRKECVRLEEISACVCVCVCAVPYLLSDLVKVKELAML